MICVCFWFVSVYCWFECGKIFLICACFWFVSVFLILVICFQDASYVICIKVLFFLVCRKNSSTCNNDSNRPRFSFVPLTIKSFMKLILKFYRSLQIYEARLIGFWYSFEIVSSFGYQWSVFGHLEFYLLVFWFCYLF